MHATQYRLLLLICLLSLRLGIAADQIDRSPISLAVSPAGDYCLAANFTAGTVSLVNIARQEVVGETFVGTGPAKVEWLDDQQAIVCLFNDDQIWLIRRDRDQFRRIRAIDVGNRPRDVAVCMAKHRAYVALGGEDAVAVIDLNRLKSDDPQPSAVVDRLSVGGIPRSIAISPDGRWLVTCCSYPCEVFVHDTTTLQQVSARKVFDGAFNPGRAAVTANSQLVILPSAVNRAFSVTAGMIDIGWVIDNRLSKLPLPDGEPADQKQLGLDIRGKAVGDANAVAVSPDERYLVVTCGGTHELLIIEYPTLEWPKGDPGDFLPEALRRDPSRFRRLKLGGRPVDLQFLDQRRVIVANYLSNALQLVDIESNQVVGTIDLGGPADQDVVRRGEAIFYDADRSMHSWFSCHTCHTDGHTSGQVFDTRNDRTYGTPKLTPSLRGVVETGPWTWHGWQTDLRDAMKRSLKESMHTEQPITDDDADSLVAFLGSLKHPPNPRAGSTDPRVVAGRQLFEGRAGCARCHAQPTYTSADAYDGAVDDPKDQNRNYNPPSLRGVSTRRRFLHTGKAKNLEQVLTKFHRPEDLVGQSLTAEEIANIIEYLRTL